ncbi:MAG: hypothetical protein ACI86M_001881 [Saprospiraceae bacterium]|jgi:hypothetical protein
MYLLLLQYEKIGFMNTIIKSIAFSVFSFTKVLGKTMLILMQEIVGVAT